VLRYHERTKHHFHRYAAGRARSTGRTSRSVSPLRRRAARAPSALAPADKPRSPPYEAIYISNCAPCASLNLASLSRLLEYSLSLTAWKQAGGVRWALRANPSSGNLHPTEGYVLIALPELGAPGLSTTRRASTRSSAAPNTHRKRASTCCAAAAAGFPRRFSSVHWREAWKYGERAFRYCQHDIGHAIGAVRIAAATLGWSALLLDGTPDETIARLLGLDRDADYAGVERESPECLLAVWPGTGNGRCRCGR